MSSFFLRKSSKSKPLVAVTSAVLKRVSFGGALTLFLQSSSAGVTYKFLGSLPG